MDDREGSAIDDDENLNVTGEDLLSELEETQLKLNHGSGLCKPAAARGSRLRRRGRPRPQPCDDRDSPHCLQTQTPRKTLPSSDVSPCSTQGERCRYRAKREDKTEEVRSLTLSLSTIVRMTVFR